MAESARHPIFVSGAYDINNQLVGYLGQSMVQLTAARPDVIGVLWNGGSSANSVSGDERWRRQFNDIIDDSAATVIASRRAGPTPTASSRRCARRAAR